MGLGNIDPNKIFKQFKKSFKVIVNEAWRLREETCKQIARNLYMSMPLCIENRTFLYMTETEKQKDPKSENRNAALFNKDVKRYHQYQLKSYIIST